MSNTLDSQRIEIGKILIDENVAELSTMSGLAPHKVQEWHKAFLKDCPTGRLNKRTFIQSYKPFLPNGKSDKYCEYVFRSFDTDHSGDIDFREFLFAISIILQQDPTKKLEWAFSMHDIDGNGFIEKEEMKKIMQAIFELHGGGSQGADSSDSKVDEIFVKMDTNCDGKISKEEFITRCLQDDYLRKLLAPELLELS